MTVNLIVSNKPSEINKKIIKFIQLNIVNLNKANIIFKCEIATTENMEEFANRDIINFPVLIHEKNKIIGVEKIIAYLKMLVTKFNSNIKKKSETDQLNDYWLDTIKMKKDSNGNNKEDDAEYDPSADIQRKLQKALESKETYTKPQKMGAPKPNLTEKEISKNTLSSNRERQVSAITGDMDDILMKKFFENQGCGD